MENKGIRALTIFCVLTLLLVIAVPFLPLSGEERVYNDTVRLHILANSDSAEDQNVKLKVRDSILEKMSVLLKDCRDHGEACKIIEENNDLIEQTARQTLCENGHPDEVSLTLGKEYYPEREYDGVSLPAGTYTSLQVKLGKAEGHNWWCVLFPTLCTGTAKPEKELAAAGFSPSQIRVLTENENPRYRVRFKIVEFWEKIFG